MGEWNGTLCTKTCNKFYFFYWIMSSDCSDFSHLLLPRVRRMLFKRSDISTGHISRQCRHVYLFMCVTDCGKICVVEGFTECRSSTRHWTRNRSADACVWCTVVIVLRFQLSISSRSILQLRIQRIIARLQNLAMSAMKAWSGCRIIIMKKTTQNVEWAQCSSADSYFMLMLMIYWVVHWICWNCGTALLY